MGKNYQKFCKIGLILYKIAMKIWTTNIPKYHTVLSICYCIQKVIHGDRWFLFNHLKNVDALLGKLEAVARQGTNWLETRLDISNLDRILMLCCSVVYGLFSLASSYLMLFYVPIDQQAYPSLTK